METIGIICEYNPFHNGHKYHIDKIKELYPDSKIILVMSSHFLQRGEVSIMNKWDKTKIALAMGVDLVAELPFMFSSQGADIFSKGALKILASLKINKLVFGAETNDIEYLTKLSYKALKDSSKIKEYLKKGMSYPKAMFKALDTDKMSPNDILGICYIKEIIQNNYQIEPICIKRTNDYHSTELEKSIVSATSIRKALKENINIKKYVPQITYEMLKRPYVLDDYFNLIKYKILISDNLDEIQSVDEGIENRLKIYIIESNNIDEFVEKVKTKRYSYNRIKRMLIHILIDFKKEEATNEVTYIRILGFNNIGKNHLNKLKKQIDLPITTNCNNHLAKLEIKATLVYDSNLVKYEYKKKPIIY